MTKTENRAAAKAYQQEKERKWREKVHAANVAADLEQLRILRNCLIFKAKVRIPDGDLRKAIDDYVEKLCLSNPSEVMSRYSTSATKDGSTPMAFFLIGLVSLDLGLTTVSSCFRIGLEVVRDQPVPTLPM
jgi:hypothetical protein